MMQHNADNNGMTTSKITVAEALAMLAEAFNEPVDSLTLERSRESIAGWDSMGALMLMSELDERFGLELTADESRAMTRVSDAIDFLSRHQLIQA